MGWENVLKRRRREQDPEPKKRTLIPNHKVIKIKEEEDGMKFTYVPAGQYVTFDSSQFDYSNSDYDGYKTGVVVGVGKTIYAKNLKTLIEWFKENYNGKILSSFGSVKYIRDPLEFLENQTPEEKKRELIELDMDWKPEERYVDFEQVILDKETPAIDGKKYGIESDEIFLVESRAGASI